MGFVTSSFIFFLLLLPLTAIAQTDGRVAVGASLTADGNESPWLSPSRDFAFGFYQRYKDNLFLLSIWFDKIPDKTVAWYAVKAGNPILVPSGSKIQLTSVYGLVLSNPKGEEEWQSSLAGAVAYGVMNDTGNFLIESRNSSKLWQSFDQPTDTLLPTQIMEIDEKLFARRKENNFSRGRFQLSLREDGNLVLKIVNLLTTAVYDGVYYSSGTNDSASPSNSGYKLIFNESGGIYVLRRNGQRSYLGTGETLTNHAPNFYQRLTLDFDGVFALYSYPRKSTGTNGNWSTVWSAPDNICWPGGNLGSGVCGFNSICRLNNNRRPTCECPLGFSLLDPDDKYGSCKRDNEFGCNEDEQTSMEDLYEMKELINTNWPTSDYDLLRPFSEQDCKTSCLNDCMCGAVIFGRDMCWKKKLPLSNGKEENGTKAFIKVRKGDRTPSFPHLPKPDGQKKQGTLIITGSILLGTSAFVNMAFIGAFCLGFSFVYHKKLTRTDQTGELETNMRLFTYKELAQATNNFMEELGRGSFGIVYKGTMQMGASDSRIDVAVKKLDRSVVRDVHQEFRTEINVIGRTHHKNLVQLLGFCEEGEQQLLVYEFLSNGTLADYLSGRRKPSWNRRTQIALAIARGLLYLHEECSAQIIHCDIKPQNILLDEYYNARISDFGLSKLLMMDQTQTKTAIRGTKGYVAPEWFRNLPVTVKVDVYSFGVLLLEIICCRRSIVDEENDDGVNSILTYWAYDHYIDGTMEALVGDETEAINDIRNLEKFLMVAFWCIQEDPNHRPTMRKVIHMLEGVVQVTVPPNPFPFTSIR
ncbi:hypothetical protein DITRI_Ditri14bG0008900 [Diplodiscus trichospermus]